MAEHRDVPAYVTDAALEASPMLERFYVKGGGALSDLRTDLSHAIAAALRAVTRPPWTDRRVQQVAYIGPDRRRRPVVL